jgi:cyclase
MKGMRLVRPAMPRDCFMAALIVAAGVFCVPVIAAERKAPKAPELPPIEVVQVRPNVLMLMTATGNVAVQIGEDGLVVVDTGSRDGAPALQKAIDGIAAGRKVRYIFNTSADRDRVGGNEVLARAGQSMVAFAGTTIGNTLMDGFSNSGAAGIVATERAFLRMSERQAAERYAAVAMPTEAFPERRKTHYLNGEGIEIVAIPAAHSDADSVVLFRRSDVLVTGAIFTPDRFPTIRVEEGGSVDGLIKALNALLGMTISGVPLPSREGGTRVIPGSGRVTEQSELVEYRDMVVIVRDRIRRSVEAGKSLEQVLAENPTQGYNALYGRVGGTAATKAFVEAVYASLRAQRSEG